MSGHFPFGGTQEETLDLYLLDALETVERAAVDDHLARRCPACEAELARARGRLAAFALTAPAAAPGAEIKHRILAAIETSPTLAPAAQHPPNPGRGAHSFGWSWIWGPLALALMLLSIILYGRLSGMEQRGRMLQAQVAEVQRQIHAALGDNQDLLLADELIAAPATRTLDVRATPTTPQGRAYLNPSRGAVLIAEHLPPAPAPDTYQMWLLPVSGNPIPAGVFQTTAAGGAVHAYLQPLDHIAGIAVSREPQGGSPQPTGPIVLAAKLAPAP